MQRALLWAILFTSCFLLWDNYQVYKGEKSFFHTEAVEQQAVADAASSVPTGKDIDATVPSAVAVKDPVVVETDRMKVTFDREGAVIVGTEMTLIPRQADWTEVGLAGLILDRKPAENLGTSIFLRSRRTAPTSPRAALSAATSRITRISTSSSAKSSAWATPTSLT